MKSLARTPDATAAATEFDSKPCSTGILPETSTTAETPSLTSCMKDALDVSSLSTLGRIGARRQSDPGRHSPLRCRTPIEGNIVEENEADITSPITSPVPSSSLAPSSFDCEQLANRIRSRSPGGWRPSRQRSHSLPGFAINRRTSELGEAIGALAIHTPDEASHVHLSAIARVAAAAEAAEATAQAEHRQRHLARRRRSVSIENTTLDVINEENSQSKSSRRFSTPNVRPANTVAMKYQAK